MIRAEDIQARLDRLDAEHQEVRDGGYALVEEILEYQGTLSAEDQRKLRDLLLEYIVRGHPTLEGSPLRC